MASKQRREHQNVTAVAFAGCTGPFSANFQADFGLHVACKSLLKPSQYYFAFVIAFGTFLDVSGQFFAISRLPALFKSIVGPSHGFQLLFKRLGSFHCCPEAVLVASGTIPGLFESIFCFLMALNAVWKHFLTKLLLAAPLEAFKKLSAPFEMSQWLPHTYL